MLAVHIDLCSRPPQPEHLGVLDRLSCALEVEPGDVLVFWGDTMQRTQDMEAESRSAAASCVR